MFQVACKCVWMCNFIPSIGSSLSNKSSRVGFSMSRLGCCINISATSRKIFIVRKLSELLEWISVNELTGVGKRFWRIFGEVHQQSFWELCVCICVCMCLCIYVCE